MPAKSTAALALLITVCTNAFAATIAPFGPPLDGPCVALYVPPTRADTPLVATDRAVWRWEGDAEGWQSIYTVPWTGAGILHLAGYAKSSKVLYVAHTSGVARSGDGGASWTEAIPLDFAGRATGKLRIAVSPTEREHALLVAGNCIWETTDYGRSWTVLMKDSGPVAGADFLVGGQDGETSALIGTADRLTLYRGNPLRQVETWTAPQQLSELHVHPLQPVVFTRFAQSGWSYLVGPFTGVLHSAQPVAIEGGLSAPNLAGSSSLWNATASSLNLISVADPALPVAGVVALEAPAQQLAPHPSDYASFYVLSDNQLYLAANAFTGLSPALIATASAPAPSPAHRWEPVQQTLLAGLPAAPVAPAATAEGLGAQAALDALIAAQPPFRVALHKALEFNAADSGDFREWERKARLRHLLPELRIEGGLRERNTDDYLVIERIDQFGIPQIPADVNLPDDIRTMGYAAVVLEWDLFDLLFDDTQVNIHREQRYTHDQRRRLIELVSKAYHSRIEKLAEAAGIFGEPTAQQSLRLRLEIDELTELLNGLCGAPVFR